MKKSYKKQPTAPRYPISTMEAKWRIFKTPDNEKYERLREALRENGFYCTRKKNRTEENKCMCKAFLDRDEAVYCGCGLYFKEERTPAEIEKYINTKPKFDEKKEKEFEKQVIKEEKAKQKMQEDYEYGTE